jgi:uncharacterized protein YbjT (DUF2867 family)
MILVTGVTGNVGADVARVLVQSGQQVRGLIRNADQEAALPGGVKGVTGDLNRPETLTSALAGVQGAFLLSGYLDMPGLLAEIRHAGVERVVLLSGSSATTGDMNNAITSYMVRSEIAVRESGVPWTILQPNSFMSNTLRWLPQLRAGNSIRIPFPDVPVAIIDPSDIGEVVAKVLTAKEHEGQTYRLSGPESLLPSDQVAILAHVLGGDLQFVGLSNADARAEMSATMPIEYVDAFFSFFVDGTVDETSVLSTAEDIIGKRPRSFEQWAVAHADAFRVS